MPQLITYCYSGITAGPLRVSHARSSFERGQMEASAKQVYLWYTLLQVVHRWALGIFSSDAWRSDGSAGGDKSTCLSHLGFMDSLASDSKLLFCIRFGLGPPYSPPRRKRALAFLQPPASSLNSLISGLEAAVVDSKPNQRLGPQGPTFKLVVGLARSQIRNALRA
jgi:hypothetical protein